MARKIYNNDYYDDSSPLSTLFKTGVFGGGVALGVKYRNEIMDKVYPVSPGKMSPYVKEIMKSKGIIGGYKSRADSLRMHSQRVIEEQSQRLATILNRHGARVVSPKGKNLISNISSFGFGDLSEVVDASGNRIGEKFQGVLKEMHGQANFLGFDGTVAKFGVGGEQTIEVPFAKLNKATGTWLVNDKGTTRASSILADTIAKDDKIGLQMMDYNTNLLSAFQDPQKRITYMNPGISAKDVIEAGRKGSKTRAEMHTISAISEKITLDHKSARDSQRVLNGIKNQAEHVYINDTHAQRMIGSTVRVSYASRMNIAELDGMKGFDAFHVTSRAVGPNSMYGDGVNRYFQLPSDIRKDTSLLSVADMNGVRGYDEAMKGESWIGGFLKHANTSFGMTGSTGQTADGIFTIRPSASTLTVERQKAQKGLFYDISKKNINDINIGMGSYGVDYRTREKLRFMPSAIDYNLTPYGVDGFKAQPGHAGALAQIYGAEGSRERGVMNLLSFVDTKMPEESMTIQRSIFNKMDTTRPITEHLTGMLTAKSGDADDMQKLLANFTFNVGDKRVTRRYPLGRLATSPKLRSLMMQQNSNIHIQKGAYLGVKDPGGLIKSADDLASYMANPERLVTATDHLIVDGGNLMKTITSITEGGDISFQALAKALPTKMNIIDTTWRAAINTHEDRTLAQMIARVATGNVLPVEASLSADLFSKVFPDGNIERKGSTETLQFLQNSILGHVAAYKDEEFVLKGNAAKQMSGYLNNVSGDEINLSKMFREGNLSFSGALKGSEQELTAQMRGSAGLLGAMRGMLIGGKVQPINDIGETLVNQVPMQWEEFIGNNKMLEKSTKPNTTIARKAMWPMWNGFMASEHMGLNQGAGFNDMKISMRDVPGLLTNMPHTLGELQLYNRNNSFKMTAELDLMQRSWASGIEREQSGMISKAKSTYIDAFGDIPTFNSQKEVMNTMLAGHQGPRIYSSLKESSEFMADSLLSSDINPTGFFINDKNTMRYIPSAEFLGNAYALNEEENTAQHFARRLLEGVSDWGQNAEQEFSAEARDSIRGMMLRNSYSMSEGFNNVTGLKIAGALYSKHHADAKYLQDISLTKGLDEMLGSAEGRELSSIFGNTITQSSADYHHVIKQELSRYANMGSGNTMDNISYALGEGSFFHQYAKDINKIGGEYNINEVTRRIVGHQSDLARQAQSMVREMVEAKDTSLLPELRETMERMMHGVAVRYPNIYQSSFGLGVIMPDINNSLFRKGGDLNKKVALGHMFRVNTTADIDGDNIMLRAAFTKSQKAETWKRIKDVQEESALWMKRLNTGIISEIVGASNAPVALPYNDALESIGKSAMHGRPEWSALGAFFTKAMTGSLSVKAFQMKNAVRGNFDETSAGIKAISKAESYFGTMISGVSEQGSISSKHLQGIMDALGNSSNTMEHITNIIGATFNDADGRKAIRNAIRETNAVPPIVMMSWGHLGNTSNAEAEVLNKSIETMLDVQTYARKVDRNSFHEAFSSIYEMDNTDDAWKAYQKNLEGITPFFDTPEARAIGIMEGDSFASFTMRAIGKGGGNVERGILGTEDVASMFAAFQNAAKRGFTDAPLDDALGQMLRDLPSYKKYSIGIANEPFLPSGSPGLMGAARRRLIGLDKLTEFVDAKILSKLTPLRAAGIVGAGILGIRAYSIATGDGSPQSPEDLPSYDNPSMESRGNREISNPRTLSSNRSFNSEAGLLTDNGVTHEQAMSLANKRSYVNTKSNNISIRHDGHNPYKSDMMMYE